MRLAVIAGKDSAYHGARFALLCVAQEMARAKAEGRELAVEQIENATLSVVREHGRDTLKIEFPHDADSVGLAGASFGGE